MTIWRYYYPGSKIFYRNITLGVEKFDARKLPSGVRVFVLEQHCHLA